MQDMERTSSQLQVIVIETGFFCFIETLILLISEGVISYIFTEKILKWLFQSISVTTRGRGC